MSVPNKTHYFKISQFCERFFSYDHYNMLVKKFKWFKAPLN